MEVNSVTGSGSSALASAYAVQSQQSLQERKPAPEQERASTQSSSNETRVADKVTLSPEARQLADKANQPNPASQQAAPAQDAQSVREDNAAAAKSVTQALNAYQQASSLA